MSSTQPTRPIYLDAVNRRNKPVLGVRFTVYLNGQTYASFPKSRPGFLKIEVGPPDATVSVAAQLGEQCQGPVTIDPGRSDWTFTFAGAGMPNVLIVCALPRETAAVLETLDDRSDQTVAGPLGDPNHYWTGVYRARNLGSDRQVVVATAGMGTANAAIVATHALRSFPEDIEHVIMVGIAGGCPNPAKPSDHVRLGDVVVADQRGVVQYDFKKQTVDGDQHRANPQRPSRAMLDAAQTLETRQLAGHTPWNDLIALAIGRTPVFKRPGRGSDVLHVGKEKVPHPRQPERRDGLPMIHRGAVGSANILLKDPALRDLVRDKWDVRAIEMEGSGIFDAGWVMGRDVMVVRGICDYCDAFKSDRWQHYAALVAAAYTRCLVEALPEAVIA